MIYSTDQAAGIQIVESPPIKTATVVIPSIGGKYLSYAILEASEAIACAEDYEVETLVVFDGPVDYKDIDNIHYADNIMVLPWNVGRHGFYGHRIYAAIGHLVNSDAVFFLDEDNTYKDDHIKTCLDKLNQGYDFVHSYRNITDIGGNFLCKDRFEAIGADPLYLVDTSSYCFRTDFLVNAGHIWHWGWGADRRFFQIVKDRAKYASTEKFTLNYRLDGNPNSPTKDFFFEGNRRAGFTKEGD